MKTVNPTVTIVIPTYNRASQLGRSISSVLGQTYGDFELIIVDDASTDNTAEIIGTLGDKRVKYIRREQNGGAAAARNTGIRAATGELVGFNDSDDEWCTEKLQRQMETFQELPSDVGVVYCDHWVINNGERRLWQSFHAMPEDGLVFRKALVSFLVCGPVFLQTAIIRRECFEQVGMLDENMPTGEDWDFIFRVSKLYRLYHMSVPLVNRFLSHDSLISNEQALAPSIERLLAKYWDDKDVGRRIRSKYLCHIGYWNLVYGHHRTACHYFLRALIACPLECSAVLLKVGGGEPLSTSVTVGTVLKAVAKLPRFPMLFYKIALRRKPKMATPSERG
jgi:glycosyltransferase involved in cell wall biosynthesis